ncbi:MAG: hypothetical protein Q7S01_06340 [bacterium]|nr:hypothetical protein [bacterium]
MRYPSPAVVTVTALLAFSGIAFAEETSQAAGSAPAPARATVIREKRADLKGALKDVQANFKTSVKDLRTGTKAQMQVASSSAERRAIERNAVQNTKALIQARKASSTKIIEQKKELARKNVGKIEQRYVVAIKQFDNLVTRIQSRIAKMKSAGADTTKAEAALARAQTAIEQVKADAQKLADLRAQDQSGQAKELRARVEAAVKQVNASMKAAHNALDKAGKALTVIERLKQKKSPATTSTEPSAETESAQTSN